MFRKIKNYCKCCWHSNLENQILNLIFIFFSDFVELDDKSWMNKSLKWDYVSKFRLWWWKVGKEIVKQFFNYFRAKWSKKQTQKHWCFHYFQDVECRIYGQSATGQNIEIKQTSRVPPGDTQMVRMSIGELGKGNYRFEAKGLTPIEFTVRER